MNDRKQTLDDIREEFEKKFQCVNCKAMCKHSHAFGRLECSYHPGELIEQTFRGSTALIHDQYGRLYDEHRNTSTSHYVVKKWSCCGKIEKDQMINMYHPYFHRNNRENPDEYYISGPGCDIQRKYHFVIPKNTEGCKKCDHQPSPYKKETTPIYEEVPADMLNYVVFPFPENILPMKLGKNKFGIIDKSLTTFPIKRFES